MPGGDEAAVHGEADGAADVAGVVRVAADGAGGEGTRCGRRSARTVTGPALRARARKARTSLSPCVRGDDVHDDLVGLRVDVPAADACGARTARRCPSWPRRAAARCAATSRTVAPVARTASACAAVGSRRRSGCRCRRRTRSRRGRTGGVPRLGLRRPSPSSPRRGALRPRPGQSQVALHRGEEARGGRVLRRSAGERRRRRPAGRRRSPRCRAAASRTVRCAGLWCVSRDAPSLFQQSGGGTAELESALGYARQSLARDHGQVYAYARAFRGIHGVIMCALLTSTGAALASDGRPDPTAMRGADVRKTCPHRPGAGPVVHGVRASGVPPGRRRTTATACRRTGPASICRPTAAASA